MLKRTALAILVLAAFPVCASAEDGRFRLGAHVSTLGGGLEVGTAFRENFSARLGFNQFSISASETSGGMDFKGDLKLSSISALADWRPWSGVTHLTGGLILNSNKFVMNATAQAGSTYTVSGATYTANGGETIDTSVTFSSPSPYLGFGWSGHPKKQGFSFSSDFGVLFQGSPKASVTTSGNWNGADITQLTTDAEAQLNKDMSSFKIYPVISVGVGYTF